MVRYTFSFACNHIILTLRMQDSIFEMPLKGKNRKKQTCSLQNLKELNQWSIEYKLRTSVEAVATVYEWLTLIAEKLSSTISTWGTECSKIQLQHSHQWEKLNVSTYHEERKTGRSWCRIFSQHCPFYLWPLIYSRNKLEETTNEKLLGG